MPRFPPRSLAPFRVIGSSPRPQLFMEGAFLQQDADSRLSIGVLFLGGGRTDIRLAGGFLIQIRGWMEFGKLFSEPTSPITEGV